MQNTLIVLLYFTPILISNVETYVLLAANLDDFKSLAKKIVPEKLAIQLADMAAASAIKYQKEQSLEEENEANAEEENETEGTPILTRNSNTKDERAGQSLKLSFEDLVQKVKERIQLDMIKDQSLLELNDGHDIAKDNEQDKSFSTVYYKQNSRQDGYNNKAMVVSVKPLRHKPKTEALIRNSDKFKYVQVFPKKDRTYDSPPIRHKRPYEEKRNEPNPNNDYIYEITNSKAEEPIEEDIGMQFSKISMLKNDSYEDYVTPEKDKYESKERDVNKETTQIEFVSSTDKDKDREKVKEYDNEDIRAVTEDLWFDYKEENVTEKQVTQDVYTKAPKKGTLIPKRDIYKFSSPNYLAKIPIIAEKYDFNEPLPEKDREVQNLKPISGVLPFAVNGKVKL